MSKLRRYELEGKPVFVTCVTYNRVPYLEANADLLLEVLEKVSSNSNAIVPAWVILPDHFHAIMVCNGRTISEIMRDVKLSFGAVLRKSERVHSGRIWQNRFWDHIIRDERDYQRHMDYIHYNPVKHGLVVSPSEWRHSSFCRFLESGYYDDDWGKTEPMRFDGDFGEWKMSGPYFDDSAQAGVLTYGTID